MKTNSAAVVILTATLATLSWLRAAPDEALAGKTIGILRAQEMEDGTAGAPRPFYTEKKAQWYHDVLTEAGCAVVYLTSADLLDPAKLNADTLDVLILPYGSRYVPADIESNAFVRHLAAFLREGGHLLYTLGGYMEPYNPRTNEFLTQEEIKQLTEENPYYLWKRACAFPLFNVTTEYPSNVKQPPVMNPEMKPLLEGLPETLTVQNNWPACRVRAADHTMTGSGFKDNLIIPLYFQETKNARDETVRVAPVWIVRHHSRQFNGATMVITSFTRWANRSNFARLYSGDYGPQLLRTLVRLCFERLPGEREDDYYATKLALKKEAVALERHYVDIFHRITTRQQHALYRGEDDVFMGWRKEKNALEEKMTSIVNQRDQAFKEATRQEEYAAVLADVRAMADTLAALDRRLPAASDPRPPTSFWFSIQAGHPGFTMSYEYFQTAAEVGINLIPYGHYDGSYVSFLKESLGVDFYTGIGSGGHHGGISRVPCSTFNETTQKLDDHLWKKNWFYSEECMQGVLDASRELVTKFRDKDWLKMYHLPNEMHIRYNQGWGERGMILFRDYVRETYSGIDAVNEAWGTEYGDFDEVTVPIKVPEGASEHARWEDWTRFRDHFITRYARDLYTMVKELDPETPVLSRYMAMWIQATKANDFSTLNRLSDINGSHGYWNSNLYTCDWVYRIGRKPFYNSEYTFHKYNKTGYVRYTRWLRRDLWHGTGNGQVGFQLYPWYWAHVPFFESYAFMESDNTPRIVTWELQNFIKNSGAWSKIVTEGESMARAPVALLYSDTSRRHQIEELSRPSPMFNEAEGWNALFRNMHTDREVLTEWDVRHDAIPESVKLIVLPGCAYLEPATYDKLLTFADQGGWVLAVNGEGAYYDNRGREEFSLFGASEVVSRKIPEPRFFEFDGRLLTEFGRVNDWYGWKVVADDARCETLVRSAEGYPVVLKAPVGRGGIIFSSVPLGAIYNTTTQTGMLEADFPESALLLRDIVKAVLQPLGIGATAAIEDPLIEVHPWYYKGETYLVFANLRAEQDARFTVTLPGDVDAVRDVINDTRVPSETMEEKTAFTLYLPKGGGMVVRLIE